jgi:hypothetical protein
MRLRRRTWLSLLAILLLVGAGRLGLSAFERAFVGPRHEFTLPDRPPFLAEDLALSKAREVLVLDGLDSAVWSARPDGRTAAPDGRTDEFLSRNLNPNLGSVRFTDGSGRSRFVSIELDGDRLVCQGSWGK